MIHKTFFCGQKIVVFANLNQGSRLRTAKPIAIISIPGCRAQAPRFLSTMRENIAHWRVPNKQKKNTIVIWSGNSLAVAVCVWESISILRFWIRARISNLNLVFYWGGFFTWKMFHAEEQMQVIARNRPPITHFDGGDERRWWGEIEGDVTFQNGGPM